MKINQKIIKSILSFRKPIFILSPFLQNSLKYYHTLNKSISFIFHNQIQTQTTNMKEQEPLQKTEPEKKNNKFQIKTPKGTRDYHPEQMTVRRKVIDSIVSIFKKHGGVQLDTPVFELREVLTGKYGQQSSKLVYDLQDQGGQKCSLRYDLTVPFARYMANNSQIQKIKRFHIGKVYRRDQPTINKGRFRQFYQCDFDIAGKYDAMIPDAEVLTIMQEILQELTVNQFLVKVNHRKILQAVIKQAGCDDSMFKTICSSIDKLDKQPWIQIQKQLITKGVSQQQVAIIGKITVIKGDPFKILDIISNGQIFLKNKQALSPTFQEMKKLFTYLEALGRIKKVSFDMSLARGLDYYTGLIFQIVLVDEKSQLGSISGGGRYDNLIGMFSKHQIPSVGGSIGIQRLFTILQKRNKDKIKKNACQVLVATIGTIPVAQKLAVVSQLWKNNIPAQILYVQKSKPDKQINHAFDNEIPIILWLAEQELKKGQFNLKVLYKKLQVKLPLANLVQAITPYIEQYRRDLGEGKISFEKQDKK